MKKSTFELWWPPVTLFIILLGGLILALTQDGFIDFIACGLMAIPVLVILIKYYFTPGNLKGK